VLSRYVCIQLCCERLVLQHVMKCVPLGLFFLTSMQHLTRTITEVKAGIGQEQRKLQGYEAEASRLTHMM
jgi:hypothetical protein